ncbi:glycosyltransferase family 39 protein, partial [bacterium]|nr:glycosyltransferase family 39 protein [candidate division CSSED10-310 bacterium]
MAATRRERTRIAGWLLVFGAIVAAVVSYLRLLAYIGRQRPPFRYVLPQPDQVFRAGVEYWFWWLGAVCLLIVAYFVFNRRSEIDPARPPITGSRLAWLLLLLVLLAGGAFRFHDVAQFPYCLGDDGAWNSLYATDLIHARRLLVGFTVEEHSKETFFMYLVALFIHLFGPTIPAVFYCLAGIGLLTILSAYLFGASFFNNRYMGVLAAALMAAAPGALVEGRIPYRRILCPLFMFMVLYFADRAFRRQQTADFLGLGISMGGGMMMYHTFRLIPAAAVLTCLVLLAVIPRFILRNAHRLLLSLISALVMFTPMIYFVIYFWNSYNGRALGEWHNFLAEGKLAVNLRAFAIHFTPFLLSERMRFYPVVSFPLFYLGFFRALGNLGRGFYIFLMFCFCGVASTYVLCAMAYPPSPHRANPLLSLYVLFVLLGLDLL